MTKCIYCLQASSDTVGEAHVVPEALGQNRMVLPRGAVCDGCNNYLGKLDGTLISHPMIAVGIQAFRTPGKSGKPRSVVGNVARDVTPNAMTIPVGTPQVMDGPDGRIYHATPLVSPTFDELRFRRSLYHVALNVLAYSRGVDEALHPRFDPVRKYVRSPQRDEAWPFAEFMMLDRMSPQVLLQINPSGDDLVVEMYMLAVLFYVDLLRSPTFAEFVSRQRTKAPTLRYIGEADRMPRQDAASDGHRYRIEIFDDE